MALGDARGVEAAAAAAKGVTRTKEDDGHLENKRRDPYDDCATEKQFTDKQSERAKGRRKAGSSIKVPAELAVNADDDDHKDNDDDGDAKGTSKCP